ncbi:MAG: DedA family protein [bacterium]|jgi:membrane-associated protein
MLRLLEVFIGLPPELIYFLVGLGSAIENVFPPIPADTFVILGGSLVTTIESLDIKGIFLIAWASNVVGALGVYQLGYRYGRPFFEKGRGRYLLNDQQFMKLEHFYQEKGFIALFLARFLPGFRVAVPVFAGITRMSSLPVCVTIGVASAVWYSLLVYVGFFAGTNLGRLIELQAIFNLVLGGLAVMIAIGCAWLWKVSRGRK